MRAKLFFPEAWDFFVTTFPREFRIRSPFLWPLVVFSLVPRKTLDFARFPFAITLFFMARRRMPFPLGAAENAGLRALSLRDHALLHGPTAHALPPWCRGKRWTSRAFPSRSRSSSWPDGACPSSLVPRKTLDFARFPFAITLFFMARRRMPFLLGA